MVLTATGNDVRLPAVEAIAEGLVDVLLQLDDTELRLCLGRWPAELAAIVPRLRDRLPDLGTPIEGDALLRSEQLRRSLGSCITALSRRAPILLVLDDLHRAGPDLLMLLGHLMKTDSEPRVAVLATARTTAPDRSSRLAHLATALEQDDLVERVILGGLDLVSVTRLLAERRIPDVDGRAAAMHALTGGQPFFLGEMLDSGEAASTSFDHLPTSVLDFVRYRAHALGPVDERLLADATVFVTSFDIPTLAAAAGASEATAREVVARSVDAHILRSIGLTTFSFAHEVTRRALAETLDDDRRAEVHRMIALALEARDEPPGLLASHWRHAAGPDAAARTVQCACEAAEAAMRRHDPAGATSWFAMACDAAAEPPDARPDARAPRGCAGTRGVCRGAGDSPGRDRHRACRGRSGPPDPVHDRLDTDVVVGSSVRVGGTCAAARGRGTRGGRRVRPGVAPRPAGHRDALHRDERSCAHARRGGARSTRCAAAIAGPASR